MGWISPERELYLLILVEDPIRGSKSNVDYYILTNIFCIHKYYFRKVSDHVELVAVNQWLHKIL